MECVKETKPQHSATNVIHVDHVTVAYQGKTAIKDVAIRIPPKNITGIVGPNGAGKSTLLKSIIGLVKKETGKVEINGSPIKNFQTDMAYVAQRSEIDLSFPIRVEEVALLGTFPKLGIFHRPKKKDKEKTWACLEMVGMEDFRKRQISELSGGQLQRVFIARALAQEANMIFLDEPFAGIDMMSERVIMDVLNELRNFGKTIVIVHHDLHKTKEYFDQLIILNHRLVASGPVSKTFTTENIQKAYGETMGDIVIKGVDES